MKIEEAIVYVLASSGYGMKTEQIAREINNRRLFKYWFGEFFEKKPTSNNDKALQEFAEKEIERVHLWGVCRSVYLREERKEGEEVVS